MIPSLSLFLWSLQYIIAAWLAMHNLFPFILDRLNGNLQTYYSLKNSLFDITFLIIYMSMEDYCVFAGTDTTGCVRIPASFCGIFGFRPSHGAVSAIGVLPNAQSLDTIGKVHSFDLL